MKDHVGCIRGFSHLSRAYYGAVCLKHEADKVDEVTLGFYHPEGGTTGEFSVSWKRLGGKVSPCLRVWDDAWHALHQFADVLARMAEHDDESMTPDAFCALLVSCGLVDRTQTHMDGGATDLRMEALRHRADSLAEEAKAAGYALTFDLTKAADAA